MVALGYVTNVEIVVVCKTLAGSLELVSNLSDGRRWAAVCDFSTEKARTGQRSVK
jgi:hypothetical protein